MMPEIAKTPDVSEIHLHRARILHNIFIAPEVYCMTLDAYDIANHARPGQFVMVYLENPQLLLPRPISFYDVNPSAGVVTIVYQVVGAGTKQMSRMQAGQTIKLLGPLGNGFLVKGKNNIRFSRVALVGGGIGVPPLYFLAKKLATRGTYVDAYLGFRKDPLLVENFRSVANKMFVTTEDGSYGQRGLITDVLQAQDRQYDEILACGPAPLLKALVEYANKRGISTQVCLEERMACGLGTCVGCVVKAGGEYIRICSEGPVFYGDEVDL